MSGLTTIGWRERIMLPGLCSIPINAKIDTGARSSAIHAFDIREITLDGVPHVDFLLHPVQRKKSPEVKCRKQVIDKRIIRSSNGHESERFVIETKLRLGKRFWKIELTLADRDAMGFRMLVGRDALRRKFIVDPGASYLMPLPGEVD